MKRQKNDAADAEAICEAAQRPTMCFVPVKNEETHGAAMVCRVRKLLIRQRTQAINALRGHLTEFGQHRGVTYVTAGDFNSPDLQCFRVDPELDRAPDGALGTAMLAGVPIAVTLHLDPSAVDQEVHRTLRPPMRDIHGKGFLASAERTEVRNVPVQADQAKQAVNEPCHLPQRHAEKHLHSQLGLDRSVTVDGFSPVLAGRLCRRPRHLGIKPALRRLQAIACRPATRGA